MRFKEILKEHLLSTFVKGSTLVTTTYVSKNYDGVAYIDMSRGNAPSMLSDVNRVYRASVNGCRISEIPATSVEPALWRKFSGTWNLDYPFGTTVEAEHPIKDWCESYVIYKNGNVKIRLKSGVAEKLLAYIFEYVVKVAKDRISNNR